MADKIQLRIVTPTRLVVDEEVDEVTAPGVLGEFGVLPNHIAFLTLLQPGVLSYKQGGTTTRLAIAGGYAEVLDNVMTVLADAAEFAGEIDIERARRAKDEAEKKLSALNLDDRELAILEAAVKRAQARLEVASQEARR
ncbi:MAG TPA: F0F1 ATP synthase subunit epsilon [Verrucomicrobiae bacterium]|jgi:F-type H+-transporting ATPase subunit epsilon|nr:F0F1 ATP synthase subunit epsilon [Verrucomicrobiae bacterium]